MKTWLKKAWPWIWDWILAPVLAGFVTTYILQWAAPKFGYNDPDLADPVNLLVGAVAAPIANGICALLQELFKQGPT